MWETVRSLAPQSQQHKQFVVGEQGVDERVVAAGRKASPCDEHERNVVIEQNSAYGASPFMLYDLKDNIESLSVILTDKELLRYDHPFSPAVMDQSAALSRITVQAIKDHLMKEAGIKVDYVVCLSYFSTAVERKNTKMTSGTKLRVVQNEEGKVAAVLYQETIIRDMDF